MSLLEVGRITRPHGLAGAVVVELISNRPERIAPGAVLHGPDGPLVVERSASLAAAGGRSRAVVHFAGLGDRDAAERCRGALLRARAIDDPDALWVHELVGAELVDPAGRVLGKVVAVESNPASDLLVLGSGALVPLRFVVGRTQGRLVVDLPPGLLDL